MFCESEVGRAGWDGEAERVKEAICGVWLPPGTLRALPVKVERGRRDVLVQASDRDVQTMNRANESATEEG